jgi:hypothetical protein
MWKETLKRVKKTLILYIPSYEWTKDYLRRLSGFIHIFYFVGWGVFFFPTLVRSPKIWLTSKTQFPALGGFKIKNRCLDFFCRILYVMEFMVQIHVIIQYPAKRAKCKGRTVSVPIPKVPTCNWIEFCPALRDLLSLVHGYCMLILRSTAHFVDMRNMEWL